MADIVPSTELSETPPVGVSLHLLLSAANVAVWLAVIPLFQLLIPAQVEALDASHKISLLSMLTFVTGLAALLSQPITGALSDRTTGRLGRRRPWIIGGMLLSIVGLLWLANVQSVFALALAFGFLGYALNMILAALLAVIPDKVPVTQRATVSAFVGVGQPLGTLLGLVLIAQVVRSIQGSYYAIAGVLCVVLLLFVLLVHEEPIEKETLPPFALKTFLKGFLINPKKYPDFSYTWLSRFCAILAQTLLATFILYYLQDVIHYERLFPGQTVLQGVALFQVIQTVFLVISTLLVGKFSDRSQRRKPFVILAGCIMSVALITLAFVPTWTCVLTVAALFGVGFGIYISADLALATQVLPSAASQGKDLGILSMSSILPELLFPLISFVAFHLFQGYTALFLIAALAAFLGAIFVIPIKSVR